MKCETMIDLLSLFYGAIVGVVSLAILKIIDMILEAVFQKTIFSKVWFWLSKNFKKLLTRLKPIRICFHFSTRIENVETDKVKEAITFLTTAIAKNQHITVSPVSWTDDNVGSTKIVYNEREYRLEMAIKTLYSDTDVGVDQYEYVTMERLLTEGISFSIETNTPFHLLEPMLLNLGALVNSIKEEMKEALLILQFSKGMFTIQPLKNEIRIDEWIKNKQFEISLTLKGRDKVRINLHTNKVEIICPTLQIDDKVAEYLKETILEYYL